MANASLLHKTISVLSLKDSTEVHLKKEQDKAINSLLEENEVLAVLSTALKKHCVSSFCCGVIIGLCESTSPNAFVLVVCPLKRIIHD